MVGVRDPHKGYVVSGCVEDRVWNHGLAKFFAHFSPMFLKLCKFCLQFPSSFVNFMLQGGIEAYAEQRLCDERKFQ